MNVQKGRLSERGEKRQRRDCQGNTSGENRECMRSRGKVTTIVEGSGKDKRGRVTGKGKGRIKSETWRQEVRKYKGEKCL